MAPSDATPNAAARPIDWHALDVDAVLAHLATSVQGLDGDEAARRLGEYGANALPAPPVIPAWRRLLRQFNDPLILFLLSAAVVAFALGHVVDAAVIVAVVTVNAIVGFVQEGRAEQALSALRSMLAPVAHVLRHGVRATIAVEDLVPGDVIVLEAGDRVPADARLLRGRGLRLDESILTGESVPVDKGASPVAADAALGERQSMLYSGTLVSAGQGSAVVVASGASTEIGRIGTLLGQVETLATPLLRQIARFGKLVTMAAIGTAAVLFVFAIAVRDYAWLDALMIVVAIAVGFVPEGLPAVITITLAIGVRRMAARHAIVRRMAAVETLGATTVICSDKTGTLTRNEMSARTIITRLGRVEASGEGYAPTGRLDARSGGDAALAAADRVARVGLLCNDARLIEKGDAWHIDGDPMEGALLALAARAGMEATAVRSAHPRLDEVPFDAAYRFMATLHAEVDGEGALVCVKGAPEQILALSSEQAGAAGTEPVDAAFWRQAIDAAGAEGQRVLGFAARKLAHAPQGFSIDEVADSSSSAWSASSIRRARKLCVQSPNAAAPASR
ncbi:MAG TPA: HAD-IC family P-type ATPase [Steroidobacteraceae bacterium]|nr:HAD-IC family P-type ATPase [Steroidobacteraceae bacterium]